MGARSSNADGAQAASQGNQMTVAVDTSSGRRAQTKLANRLAILDAAREVFGEMGFEAATVRDIIRRTNLSVGAFYNYYRSKDEVFAALADDGARRFRPILRAVAAEANDFESYLRAAIRSYFDFLKVEQEVWRLTRPGGESVGHVRNTPEIIAVFDEVRSVFADAMERGLAPKVDLDYLAAGCIAVAREIGDRMMERRPVEVEPAVEFVVRLIIGGVGALPRSEF